MAALVTGAAKRLGRAMALALAEAGHDVVVHYAGSQAEAEATVAETMPLDYELYAEGEALLGWLNCTVRLSSATGTPFDGNQTLFQAGPMGIGHEGVDQPAAFEHRFQPEQPTRRHRRRAV